jgi:hypothetical protein
MDMFDEEVVLCASSAYEKKFYLNEEFSRLPEDIKNELKIMCVLFTEEVGGILELVFDEEGNLLFRTDADDVYEPILFTPDNASIAASRHSCVLGPASSLA